MTAIKDEVRSSSLERQIHKLPKEVVWCKKCLMSNQRPRIIFDKEGVCSACRYAVYKHHHVDWNQREAELEKLLDQHRSQDGSWDVIVPSSGGKDSGYVAHQLKYQYGMNPLTVTWAPLMYTNLGRENFDSLVASGLSNILYTPNGALQRKLARLCFEELGDAFHVFVLGQFNYPFHMAKKLGIKLIFYGENGEAEYGGDPEFFDKPFKPISELKEQHFKGVDFQELVNYGIKHKDYFSESDVNHSDLQVYMPPQVDELEELGILGKCFFSYFKKWVPQENYYYCVKHTGFKPNKERSEGTYSKYASLDDKTDGFHYFMRYIKFGLGRCVEDASHEIRDGHISREEGIALANRFEGEFPKKYHQEFLEYLGVTEDHFWRVVDSWRLGHLWVKVDSEWSLRTPAH